MGEYIKEGRVCTPTHRGTIRAPCAEKGEAHKLLYPTCLHDCKWRGTGRLPREQLSAETHAAVGVSQKEGGETSGGKASGFPRKCHSVRQRTPQGVGASHLYSGLTATRGAAASVSTPAAILELRRARNVNSKVQFRSGNTKPTDTCLTFTAL